MRKLLAVSLILFLAYSALYADGNVTTNNDKNIEVKTLQSGSILLTTYDNRVSLDIKVRDRFIEYLKAHLDCMNKFSEEGISISNKTETGRLQIASFTQYRFSLLTNHIENYPYILSIGFYESNDRIFTYTFDTVKLKEFIDILEGTKTNTNEFKKQNARVRELISNIRISTY